MLRSSRIRIIAATLTALVGVTVLGCSRPDPAKKPEPPKRSSLDIVVKKSEIVQSDESGRPLWKINAAQTRLNEQTQSASVESGRVQVLSGEETRILVSFGKLEADARGRQLIASGGITAESPPSGTKFSATKVKVDLRTNRISASGKVEGSTPSGSFSAGTLESDIDLKRIVLSGPNGVRGRIVPR